MTPEAQRIAIAEACGHIVTDHASLSTKQWRRWYDDVVSAGIVPDYLTDLNAMHEAEETLTEEQREDWVGEFHSVVARDEGASVKMVPAIYYSQAFPVLHATAAQRAEAFLRTLNLWDDTK